MLTEGCDEIAVSTIVEHLFQYLDEDLIAKNRRYQQLERGLRLRSALFVFDEAGLAQSSEVDKSLPMLVPTKDFMEALGTSHLTTLVKPLHLPVWIDISRSEADKYYDYAVDLRRSLEDVPRCLARMRALLGVSELGWAEQKRGDDGRLCWNIVLAIGLVRKS